MDCNMSSLFVPVKQEWYQRAPQEFDKKMRPKNREYNEISKVLWVDETEFCELLKPSNNKFWKQLKQFYSKNYNEDINNTLKLVYVY